MKLSGDLALCLLLACIILSGCDQKTGAENYFTQTGIQLPVSSNEKVNKLIAEFPKLYNALSAAVADGDKDARLELINAYADWLIQLIEAKESLSDDEKAILTTKMETINTKWTEQIDRLL